MRSRRTIPRAQPFDEVKHHEERQGQPYSLGHRIMYDTPAAFLRNTRGRVLDVGHGIGYGLQALLRTRAFAEYVGCEIDPRCQDFAAAMPESRSRGVSLIRAGWPQAAAQITGQFDHAFCIEVIEHVEPAEAPAFLAAIQARARTLWISTPESDRSSHGIYTAQEMQGLLSASGFVSIVTLREQWTTLYIAQT